MANKSPRRARALGPYLLGMCVRPVLRVACDLRCADGQRDDYEHEDFVDPLMDWAASRAPFECVW